MGRRATGTVVEYDTKEGPSAFAIRFRALGQRQYRTLGTRAEGWTPERAEQELGYTMERVRRGLWVPREPDPPAAAEAREVPSFHVFASEWFEAQKVEGGRKGTGRSGAGAHDLEWRLSHHLLPAFASKRLDEISVEDVDRYRRGKLRDAEVRTAAIVAGKPLKDREGNVLRPLGPTSINKTLSTLAAILEVAVEYELVQRNVAKGRRRRLPATKPRRTWLDRADHIAALLDGAGQLDAAALRRKGQRRALLATLVFAGLRISECLALRWGDVDLARGTLAVRASKTDAGVRKVTILPALRDELLAYRAGLGDVAPGVVVFCTSTGKPLSVSNVRRRVLLRAIEQANAALTRGEQEVLPDGLTPHSLRRTFASLLYALGEAPPYVMAQMGHTTPHLALAIYARVMDRRDGEPERLRALVEGAEWAETGRNAAAAAPAAARLAA